MQESNRYNSQKDKVTKTQKSVFEFVFNESYVPFEELFNESYLGANHVANSSDTKAKPETGQEESE